MQDIFAREAINPDQVVMHSDNGNPMKVATLQTLGVAAPSLRFCVGTKTCPSHMTRTDYV
ncbi:MAG TPA: hypothetical protein PKG49_12115 [Nitrosomonas mobilis]|nr:hypothetical protein [Nitrosomonas mobilis]